MTAPGLTEELRPTDEAPLENPRIEVSADDPLLVPHPDEPGVRADGTAAPLENPGSPFPAIGG
jgi:hypothetical protein